MAMEPNPDGKGNSSISIGGWHHNACNTQSAKTPFLCTTAVAKSNSEDNPVQMILAIGQTVLVKKMRLKHTGSVYWTLVFWNNLETKGEYCRHYFFCQLINSNVYTCTDI